MSIKSFGIPPIQIKNENFVEPLMGPYNCGEIFVIYKGNILSSWWIVCKFCQHQHEYKTFEEFFNHVTLMHFNKIVDEPLEKRDLENIFIEEEDTTGKYVKEEPIEIEDDDVEIVNAYNVQTVSEPELLHQEQTRTFQMNKDNLEKESLPDFYGDSDDDSNTNVATLLDDSAVYTEIAKESFFKIDDDMNYNGNLKLQKKMNSKLIRNYKENPECSYNVKLSLYNKDSSDKKQTNHIQWLQNQRKLKINSGLEHFKQKNQISKEPLSSGPKPCNCSCSYKCNEKLTEEARINIYKSYWQLRNYGEQRKFINQTISLSLCKTKQRRESRRNFTLNYKLNNVRVCKKFYIKTLSISESTVRAVKNKEKAMIPVDEDCRSYQRNVKNIDSFLGESIGEYITNRITIQ